jgi:hypothetical protein
VDLPVIFHDEDRYCPTGLQPYLEARPDRPQPARYGFLQALDAADDLGAVSKVDATFSLINRTTTVRLAEEIDEGELREQLDHARTLRFGKKEMIWLAGNTFYGSQADLRAGVPAWLEGFQLPEYHLEKRDGQYELTFHGRGSTPRCGRSRRSPSSTSCARAAMKAYRPLCARRALCPGQGQDVGEGRAAEAAPGAADIRFRHAPPA